MLQKLAKELEINYLPPLKKSFFEIINELKNTKNLLAFSFGVDSAALYFLLYKFDIKFDIALVNYNTRENSKKEQESAKALSNLHNKIFFTKNCKLEDVNFEKNARDFRYSFFEKIIQKHSYDVLITAHQLNDKLEWFFMQMTKGAGLSELYGFDVLEKRENYKIVRPLIESKKSSLLEFLKKNNLPYFVDESNFDEKYKRNSFRKLSESLLQKYENGISNTFNFIKEDKKELVGDFCFKEKQLYVFERKNQNYDTRMIDKACKNLGLLISQKQREEIYIQQSGVLGGLIAFGLNEKFGFICPYTQTTMPKKIKEQLRILKVPKHIRAYICKNQICIEDFPKIFGFHI